MPRSPIADQYGEPVDLGTCIVGTSLNQMTVRGFARLGVLAATSAPDVHDQIDNLYGTHRSLKSKHALACFDHALDSLAVTPEDNPRRIFERQGGYE